MGRRGFVPLLLAVGFGVANGVATFGPSFQEQEREKQAEFAKQHDVKENQPETTPEPTTATHNPSPVIREQKPKPEESSTSRWSISSFWSGRSDEKKENDNKDVVIREISTSEADSVKKN
ncbi:hypothetical protein L228DRAFT_250295 [Xylona heveae TC161]|uniref:Uncharacterized protein n=1 Tax=Xylona heveae (strain CBS 132557 / TC161) TaxID=1328760 RepID=A0A165A2Q4_XYLHT|nr:hypothetical protein L228DRAFT_250295 [Xylona heveae TC161]KZF19873.1 hypothetical protein L228DRAFT_250295 [Xylona heveae TC161]